MKDLRTHLTLGSLLLFCVLKVYGKQPPLPAQYHYNWQQAGMQEQPFTPEIQVNIADFGADLTGIESSYDAWKKALAFTNNRPALMYFPAGRYYFDSALYLRDSLLLQGNGSKTTLIFNLDSQQDAIIVRGNAEQSDMQIQSSIQRGNTAIALNQNPKYTDALLQLTIKGEDLVTSSWGQWTVGQIFEIDSVVQNQVFSQIAARRHYAIEEEHRITWIKPIRQVGIECLAIERKDVTSKQTSNIYLQYATECWVKNVESHYSNFAHLELRNSYQVSVSQSYFHDAHHHGNGGKAYGSLLHFTTSDCLIEDNVFEKLRHSMLLQAGANGNVFGYNYSLLPKWTEVSLPKDAAGDIVLHGNYPYANLFERNVVQNMVIDDSHGANGPHNALWFNHAKGFGLFMNSGTPSDSQIIVGNSIPHRSWYKGLFQIAGVGHYNKGNVVKGQVLPVTTLEVAFTSLYKIDDAIHSEDKEDELPAESRYKKKELLDCAVSQPVGNETTTPSVAVYPNPSQGKVTIEGSFTKLQVWNQRGALVETRSSTSEKSTVDIHLPQGFYIMMLETDQGLQSQKLLVL